jgi:Rap1a immunity proteins
MKSLTAVALMLCALGTSMLWAPGAAAEESDARYVDGNLLYQQLVRRSAGGTGYILGINDGVQLMQVHSPAADRVFCTPTGATGEELANVVLSYLEAELALRDLPAGILVIRALALRYPCGTI